ncbi:DUF368 domain-containing protein [Gaopeijia maritima]|uniref:DUF368 domain-containing protein n=1 Tax=Gaopeijia maritima TaxID=3119007 RepID=A0ABU9E470_9BACT
MSTDPELPEAVPEATPPRVFVGGVLMGLANLVPGVSGGTMILALGLYDRFIASVADLARLRFEPRSIVFVAVLAAGLAVAVLGLATPAVWLVQQHRWLAYSLFIGMTLGGVPLLWAIVRPLDARVLFGALVGFAVMAVIAFGLQSTTLSPTVPVFVAAGALAASSMILPGVSGSYVLLILGLYDVVIGSLRPAALRADLLGSLGIIIPVGIGAVLGIGLLSNGLRWFLARWERLSHALLLGLLVGSVLGLWPFQGPAWPDLAVESRLDAVKALVAGESPEAIRLETGVDLGAAEVDRLLATFGDRGSIELELMALRLERYRPTLSQIGISLVTMAFGFALTLGLGGLGTRSGTPKRRSPG